MEDFRMHIMQIISNILGNISKHRMVEQNWTVVFEYQMHSHLHTQSARTAAARCFQVWRALKSRRARAPKAWRKALSVFKVEIA